MHRLRHQRDARPPAIRRRIVQRHTRHGDRARLQRQQTRHGRKRARLARPARPRQHHRLPRPQIEVRQRHAPPAARHHRPAQPQPERARQRRRRDTIAKDLRARRGRQRGHLVGHRLRRRPVMPTGRQIAQRLEELGREQQQKQPLAQRQRRAPCPEIQLPQQREPHIHRNHGDADRREQLQHRRRQERDPQHRHGPHPQPVGPRRQIRRRPVGRIQQPQVAQGRQPVDQQVVHRPDLDHLILGRLARGHAHQRHEHRNERPRQQEHNRHRPGQACRQTDQHDRQHHHPQSGDPVARQVRHQQRQLLRHERGKRCGTVHPVGSARFGRQHIGAQPRDRRVGQPEGQPARVPVGQRAQHPRHDEQPGHRQPLRQRGARNPALHGHGNRRRLHRPHEPRQHRPCPRPAQRCAQRPVDPVQRRATRRRGHRFGRRRDNGIGRGVAGHGYLSGCAGQAVSAPQL